MLRVNNWSSLQSYKDRKPPWIRLHKTLLDNFEFHSLSKNARALLPMLWLLASEHEDPTSGIIKHTINQISFRLRMPKKELESGIKECIASEFIEQYQSCNESVTKQLQNSNSTVTPETETETETDYKKPLSDTSNQYNQDFLNFWTVYPKKTGKGAAWKSWKKEAPNILDVITSLSWQKNSKQWIDGFIPLPTTYLNQRRWEDEPEEETVNSSKRLRK